MIGDFLKKEAKGEFVVIARVHLQALGLEKMIDFRLYVITYRNNPLE